MDSCTRSDIDQPVGMTDKFFLMFNNYHGVPFVAEFFEDLQQLLCIPCMQSDRWFVEEIQYILQPGCQLIGEPQPLCFTSRETA